MNPLDPPDRTMRRVLLGLAVFFAILAACLIWSALDASRASALSYGACYEDREETWLEFERTIVVQDEVVELEHQLAKHTRERTKTNRGWSDWSEPVLYEPLSHETWVTEIPDPNWQPHHRSPGLQRDWALLPTGYADTVVVTPEVAETEIEWFASPPEDDWTPTGNARTEIIEVEVPCPEEPETPPTTIDTPPTTVDESFEAEADHTDPPAQPVEEVETSSISTERPTLPRTGIKEDIASVGLVLLFVGGSLLGVEAYDRRKRRA